MARRTTTAAAARRRLLLLGVGAGLLVLLAAWPAAAHAVLVASDPAAGSVVATAPRRIGLAFSEVIEASPNPVTVLGPDRRPLAGVRAGPDPADRTRLAAELPGGLGQGTYEVRWGVLALDGHAVRGAFRFAVGSATPVPGGPPATAATGPGPLEIAGRALAVAGALAAFGLAAFPLLVIGPAARRQERGGGAGGLRPGPPVDRGSRAVLDAVPARLRTPVRVAVLVSAAGTVLLLAATAAGAAGPAGAGPGPGAVLGQVALGTRPGRLLLARLVLLGGLWAQAGRRGLAAPGRVGRPLAAGLALAALGTFSLTGHAVAVPADAAVAVLLDWTHLAAAGLWTGGLVALAVAGRAAPAPGGRRRGAGDITAALTSGFSTVAQVAMVAVAATGAYAALVRVDALDDLGGTAWGTELAVKVALWLTVVPVATANALRLVPRISARVGRASQRRAASGELGTVVRLELALAAALLVVAAAMSASSPPAGGQPPAAVAATAPAAPARLPARTFGGSGGRYRLQVRVERSVEGPAPGSTLELRLSSEGAPAAASAATVVLRGHVIEGNDGADVALGGEGNDIITDSAGDDVPKGGPGNDAIDAGPGLDIVMGGEGKDFTNGGANINETFAGAGDDFVVAGQGEDAVFGDSGSDWEEGGDQPDLLQGDSGDLFFLDTNQPGSDVLIGQGGDDDYDAEGGDDIMVAGPGIEKNAGAAGYDWSIGLYDPQPQNADLNLPFPALDTLTIGVRDRFNEVEALSGWDHNDTLRGDDVVPTAVGGGGFIGCDALDQAGLDRIAGLDPIVPPLATDSAPIAAASAIGSCPLEGPVWGDGNILLGGAGSDLIEGRGANDIIDGDRYLNVRLSVRTVSTDPSTEIGTTDLMEHQYLRDANGRLTGPTLQQAVFAGTVDPGNIVLVREILSNPAAGDVDTAQFSDVRANYDITTTGDTTTVSHLAGAGADGTDTLRNVEQLRFADETIPTPAPVVLTAPGAPTLLTVTPSNTSATLTFAAPADTGGSPITGFEVDVRTGTTVVRTVTGLNGNATSTVITGLTNGTAYNFVVRAVNAVGTGPDSAASDPVTPATAPSAPTIGTAVGGNAQATVTWTAPANDGGSPITGYELDVRTGTTVVRTVTGLAAGATSTAVTGLTNGTTYNFRVRAVNAAGAGAFSEASNAVTPATVPGAPVIGSPQRGATGGALTAIARWSPPAANGGSAITGYRVTALRMSSAAANATVVSRTNSPVLGAGVRTREFTLPAGNYRFQVVAINAVGTSAPSARSANVVPR